MLQIDKTKFFVLFGFQLLTPSVSQKVGNSTFTDLFNNVASSVDIAEYLSARYGYAMEILKTYTELEVTNYWGAMIYWDCMKVQVS